MNNTVEEINIRCTGCGLCSEICPKKAIMMTQNDNGYRAPIINKELCVECGKCLKNCPVNNAGDLKVYPKTVYVLKNKSLEDRMRSTSGGVFILLARSIISDQGCVYGAVFDEDMNVVHIRSDNFEDIAQMSGSKYVQSNIEKIFALIQKDVLESRKVLFSGTPCQVAALKQFLKLQKLDEQKVLLVEIQCYGVPSPKIWKDHIKLLNGKYGDVCQYTFRDKKKGWSTNYLHLAELKNGQSISATKEMKSLRDLYSLHLNIRESCFHCAFSDIQRCADLTIGDCWGVDELCPEMRDNSGVSQMFINTEKGYELWQRIRDDVDFLELSIDRVRKTDGNLKNPVPWSNHYYQFWEYYRRNGYYKTIVKYTDYNPLVKVCRKIYRKISRIIKR